MALIIEDGTGVLNADSYVTLAEVRAYATARGLTVPVADADLEPLVRKAKDYLEAQRDRYKGVKTNDGLTYLQWPRSYVVIDGYTVATDAIPQMLKDAQCQLAYEIQTIDPMKSTSGQVVRRERFDVIETEYAVNYKAERELPAYLPKVEALLQPLYKTIAGLAVTRI